MVAPRLSLREGEPALGPPLIDSVFAIAGHILEPHVLISAKQSVIHKPPWNQFVWIGAVVSLTPEPYNR